jgi:predicted phage-related endonuclease
MERKGFIGGSDAVKIMNGNWYELWQIKRGLVEPEDLSRKVAVQMGITTESMNLRWFEHEYNKKIINEQRKYTREHNGVPYAGTIDGLIWTDHLQVEGLIEAKHTFAHNTLDKVCDYYMAQVQLYLWLSDSDGVYMSVLFGNNRWECSYIKRHDSYISVVLDACTDFWAHVESGDEPIGHDQPIASPINQIPIDDMIKRDASMDNHFTSIAQDYIEYEGAAKSFDSAKKDLKAMVADNEREVYSELLTIRRDKRGALRISKRSK